MTVHRLPHHRADRTDGRTDDSVQGALALDLGRRDRPLPRPLADVIGIDTHVDTQVDAATRRGLDAWVQRFVQATVEVVGGDRPVTQLLRWSTSEVYADLQRRAQLVARAGGHDAGQERVQPVRPHVASVRTSFVGPRVVEASARVRYGERSRALALRFERRVSRRDGARHWVCVAVEFA
ncbi:Rv3235 family protein [Nocardioides flavescens]|uniref:Uncharacterized protein n=1 Tax=Nocardioides flavescens TaxID=2691959 RepID=A0A6L7EYU2_9ACTN|nr:Rv3235 family protein [Nocardioides flavescens]MXG89615.1 hypothetical protein [Nocardioides flavescens]